jgi:hypothetical protein
MVVVIGLQRPREGWKEADMLHDPHFAAVMETARVERLRAGFTRRRRQNKTATSASRPAAIAPRPAAIAPRPAATAPRAAATAPRAATAIVDLEERPASAASAAR